MLATYVNPKTETSAQPRIAIPKRLDLASAASCVEECRTCFRHSQKEWLVLDFREVEFIDSCGVKALIQIGKLAWTNKFRIVAWGMKPHVENLLKDTGCDLFIHFDSCLKAA